MASELAFLESVLNDSSAELERSSLISPADPSYDKLRLRLAAVILHHAGDGECDPAELKRATIESLLGGQAGRGGADALAAGAVGRRA